VCVCVSARVVSCGHCVCAHGLRSHCRTIIVHMCDVLVTLPSSTVSDVLVPLPSSTVCDVLEPLPPSTHVSESRCQQ